MHPVSDACCMHLHVEIFVFYRIVCFRFELRTEGKVPSKSHTRTKVGEERHAGLAAGSRRKAHCDAPGQRVPERGKDPCYKYVGVDQNYGSLLVP